MQHLIGGGPALAEHFEVAVLQAGEHGDAQHLWPGFGFGGRIAGGMHHGEPAGGMDVEHRHPEARDGAGGAFHGVGNVVEFRIGEDRQPHLHDLPYRIGAERGDEFEADLQPADMGFDGARDFERAGKIGRVEGDKDRVLESGGSHGGGVNPPPRREQAIPCRHSGVRAVPCRCGRTARAFPQP